MTVAVIGTGNMGAGIARLLASKGERVVIGSRDPAKAAKLAEEIGAGAEGGGIAAAAKLADVVIFAVNYPQAGEAVREAGGFAGKELVDISNPSRRTTRTCASGTPPRPPRNSRSSRPRRRW